MIRGYLRRLDSVPTGIGGGDQVADAGSIDLQRIDAQIAQTAALGKPKGQLLQADDACRRLDCGDALLRENFQRMLVAAILALDPAGQVGGEYSVFDGEPASARVESLGPSRLARIEGVALLAFLDGAPSAGVVGYRNRLTVLIHRPRKKDAELDLPWDI